MGKLDDILLYLAGKVDDVPKFPRRGDTPTQHALDMQKGGAALAESYGSGQRLRKGEYAALKELGATAAERRDITNKMLDYRNKYNQEGGFQDFDFKLSRKDKGGEIQYEPQRAAGQTGFNYNRNAEGKPFVGVERQGAVNELATKMAQGIRQAIRGGSNDAYNVMKSRKWYTGVRDELRKSYGGRGGQYSQKQAAASPNNKLSINYQASDEFFKRYMQGDFDKLLAKVDTHLNQGGTIDSIPDKLLPKKKNGKLYGMHGRNLLKVLTNDFRAIKTGTAPKMRNYDLNLIGESDDATIDMWAARHIQELTGRPMPPPAMVKVGGKWEGSGWDEAGNWLGGKNGPRVQQEGPAGEGQWATVAGLKGKGMPMRVGGEYGFGMDVYNEAANMLRQSDPDKWGSITARDLQAMGWLDTQNKWKHKGWGMPAEGASLIDMIKSGDKPTRFEAGASVSREGMGPPLNTQERGRDILLDELPGAQATDTQGTFALVNDAGDLNVYPEKAFDYSALVYGDYNSVQNKMMDNLKEMGVDFNQDAMFLSRRSNEQTPTSLPGIEIYTDPNNPDILDQLPGKLLENDIPALTQITDPSGKPVGVRSQFVPAFEDPNDILKWSEDLDAFNLERANRADIFAKAIDDIKDMPGVNSVFPTANETRSVHSIDNPEGSWWSGGRRQMPWPSSEEIWAETPAQGLTRMSRERAGVPTQIPWPDTQSIPQPSIFRGRE